MAASLPEHKVVSAAQVETDFKVSHWVDYPFADFAKRQEQRVYAGGLHVAGDFECERDVDWQPYNIVVDGDLTVDGSIDWFDYASGCYVLVTGNVRCKNLLLQGCPTFVVRGDLIVENGIQGHHGDDGGFLIVGGVTKAKVVVSTLYFNMSFRDAPAALVCADPHRISCAVDFDTDELGQVFLPELLDGEGIDEHAVQSALKEGKDVLRSGVVPAHKLALAEIDALVAKKESVKELDLKAKKLREFPLRVLELTSLEKLVLDENNAIKELPPQIAELAALKELSVSSCGLTKLPDEIAKLTKLETLDVSGNDFDELPPVIGKLGSLRSLDASSLCCTIPDALGDAANLEELDISSLRSEQPLTPHPFPSSILRLTKLKKLDLSSAAIADVPTELADLADLEELDLSGAIGGVTQLPPLEKLTKLRKLKISGGKGNSGGYPQVSILDRVWGIASLEELAIDRYGEQKKKETVLRPATKSLPDDAFAKMPKLRVLVLSFNELETLPESFYALTKLESVDLHYTHLNRETLERLKKTFPRVRVDLRKVKTRFDVDDPNWKKMNETVKRAAKLTSKQDYAQAVPVFEEALTLATPGACYSDYDELYALYGVVDAISRTKNPSADLKDKLVRHATTALERVPAPGMIWHYTDEGAFQEEVTRRAGNALAWNLMERGDIDRALAVIDRALSVGGQNAYAYDTKVRILLKVGRDHDAYLIVDRILAEDPSFGDFQDLRASDAFGAWQKKNRK